MPNPFQIGRCSVIALALLLLCGCQWVGFTDRATPQICGRVLSAETQQPLTGVQVLPVLPGQPSIDDSSEKGAQRLLRGRPVTTDAEGRFTFPSRDYITLFKGGSWWSLKLSFQAYRYATLQTNFSGANVHHRTTNGIPQVDAGDIFLKPLSK